MQYWRGIEWTSDFARLALFGIWVITEPIRMSAGWYGNLQENVRLRASELRPPQSPDDDSLHASQVPWLILFMILSFAPINVMIYYVLKNGSVSILHLPQCRHRQIQVITMACSLIS